MAMVEKVPSNSAPSTIAGGVAPTHGSNEPLTPAAQRALAEAQARRTEINCRSKEQPKELHGRPGPNPTRYGDWEINGIASDF